MNEIFKNLSEQLQIFITTPYVYYTAGVAFGLFLIVWGSVSYRRSHRAIVPFKSQGGSVEIAPHTLKGVINLAVQSIEGIEKAGCYHRSKGRHLAIYVGIHLRSSVPLKKVEAMIKNRIKSVLFEQFGIENVEPIHIKVNRIVGDSYPSLKDRSESEELESLESNSLRDGDDDRPYADEIEKA